MSPILFKIGKLTLYSYGVLTGLGIVIGMWLAERKALRLGFSPTVILDLFLIEAVLLLVGSRTWYVIQNWSGATSDPASIFRLSEGGFVFYGGLVLGVPAGMWFVHKMKQPVLGVADLVAPCIALGHAFGRVGCFLEGCCHGCRSDVSWAVEFPKFYSATRGLIGSPAFLNHVKHGWVRESELHSLPVHPVQLYAAVSLLLLFGVLILIARKKTFDGQVMWSYLTLYPVIRFILEEFRVNEPVFFGLSTPQVASILIFAVGLAGLLSKGRIIPASVRKRWQ